MVIERDVAETIVKPVDPFELRVLDGFDAAPRFAPADRLGFLKGVDRLGKALP